MPAVQRVLVVGAGVGGAAVAVRLAEAGVTVDLVERRDDIPAGSGISLQGNALRVLRQLGVWAEVAAGGYGFDSLGFRAPDEHGSLITEVLDARTGGPDLPASLGIHRPLLARILVDRALDLGATIAYGTVVTALDLDGSGVSVTLDDGTTGRYDLVVGADGVNSSVRRMVGIDLVPESSGVGVWRVLTGRPASVTRTELYYGGPSLLAGYTPTGQTSLYAFISEPATDRSAMAPDDALALLRELSEPYHGPWDDIRESLVDPSRIHYAVPQSHIVEGPWNRGRAVVIGDAAHSCPPSLAQGAAMALEDAVVLAELLIAGTEVDDDLWSTFLARRYDRVKLVVDASNQLNAWQLHHQQGDAAGVMSRVAAVLAQPA